MAARKDNKGRALRKGEFQRASDGKYVYGYVDPNRVRRYIYSKDLKTLREREEKLLTRADLAIDDGNIGLKGSPTRVMKSFTKAAKGKGTVVDLDARSAADWITERLQEKFVL